jgi:hypothetical protein
MLTSLVRIPIAILLNEQEGAILCIRQSIEGQLISLRVHDNLHHRNRYVTYHIKCVKSESKIAFMNHHLNI